ncbi:MAG: acetamidase/formamidase family protein [Chloroflexi bacterium]|nr:acetamidase/formamidase family protein [Chloroflexota bacterium]
MKYVTRDHVSYVFWNGLSPVLEVEPGEQFILETEDALSGRVRSEADAQPEAMARFNAERDAGRIGANPVTGPVFVRGAEPGDSLAVRIQAIELESPGVTRFRHGHAHAPLCYLFDEDKVKVTPVVDGQVVFNERIRIPIRPMVGTIGTAPMMEALASGRAGIHGGNMDVPDIAPGATVLLPVCHPGALLFAGDVHAVMGDAEICNTAIEIRSRVTLSARVHKGRPRSMMWPRVETPDAIMTVASGTPLDQTLQAAFRDLILWMEEDYGWDRAEAYLLATQVADGRLCSNLAVRAIMPKKYLG